MESIQSITTQSTSLSTQKESSIDLNKQAAGIWSVLSLKQVVQSLMNDIKANQARMEQASEELKKSETGEN